MRIRRRKGIFSLLWFAWAFGLAPVLVSAQDTGKISGRAVDAATGEPLPGVNILIEDSGGLGAATDASGEYFILQAPPGAYTVRATFIGFRSVVAQGVQVQNGLTTRLDFEMTEEVIQGEEIVVLADDPIIRPDITSTRRTATREELASTPGMEQALDMFRTQAGTVLGAAPQSLNLGDGQTLQVRDQSVKDVHVRGGRGGEMLFLVDGMPVTHPLYGGRSVLELNVNDVDQVELLTGAFNAEYGQAQSGVVNISTRSGSERYEGGAEYRSDALDIFGTSRRTDYLSFFLSGPVPGVRRKDRLNFFLSGNSNLTDTPYDNGRSRGTFRFFGAALPERQDNTAGLNARLDWRLPDLRIGLNYNGSAKRWSNFDWLWRDFPDHVAIHERRNHHVGLHVNHTLSPSTFYSVRVGYLAVRYDASLDGRQPSDTWRFYADSTTFADGNALTYEAWHASASGAAPFRVESIISPPAFDLVTGFFGGEGYENIWRNDETGSYTFKGDITSQVHARHLVKAGVEAQRHRISYVDVQDGGVTLSPYGRKLYRGEGGDEVARPPGPFPEFGQNRWVFDVQPVIVGVYAQDKFELNTLIINAGVRMDGFFPGDTVFEPDWRRQWEAATGFTADWSRFRYKVSPRFGISFPVNLKTVFFFSYGHFTQLPELQFYYRDPYTGGLTGNPHLDYEQTILYEFGFKRELAANWALDAKAYAKDISKQVGALQLQAASGFPVSLYDNNGYARARGLELEVDKRLSGFFSGNASYTIQWATGFASSAFEQYVQSVTDFPLPIRERRLSWDVRHQFVLQGRVAPPPGRRLELFGWRLPGRWEFTVLSRAVSGSPYTPGNHDPAELQKLDNTSTGPPVFSTDLKFRKAFRLFDRAEMALFVDVFNVFNQRNVQIVYGFNPWTGKPFRYGDVFQDSERGLNYHDAVRLMDPRQFSTGRYGKLGLSLNL